MGELLSALALAWPRLLIYPGGIGALAIAWLLARGMALHAGPHSPTSPPLSAAERGPGGEVGTRCGLPEPCTSAGRWGSVADILPPLLALALLPVPPARSFPYGIDLVVALALLGWPRLRAQAARGAPRAETIRGYGLLLLGATLISAGAGGTELSRVLWAPETALGWGLLLGGSGLWLAGHARLYDRPDGWAERLGDLGHLWVGALPILAALAVGAGERLPAGWAGWMLPPLALLTAALAMRAALSAQRYAASTER